MLICLVATVAYSAFFVMDKDRAEAIDDGKVLLSFAIFVWLVSITMIACCGYDQKPPLNFILLLLHTFGTAHILTYCACRHNKLPDSQDNDDDDQ